MSNEWVEWNLTPNGWKRGSEKYDFGFNKKEIPLENVLTLRIHKIMNPNNDWERVDTEWESDNTALVETLKEKFGDRP